MHEKSPLRAVLRVRRRDFVTGADIVSLNRAVAERILPHLADARIVAGYLAIGGEVDPMAILVEAARRGIVTALPHVVDRAAAMRFLRWLPGDPLIPGPFGLSQPREDADEVAPDLILVPLVGFDRALTRLGQGAGHYDRVFPLHPAARRIGLAWSVQEEARLPVDPWDVALHGLATEREWIEPA